MSEYKTRVARLTVLPHSQALYSDLATNIEIVDEAAGEFLEISQTRTDGLSKIAIDPLEWPAIRAAIEQMISYCVVEAVSKQGSSDA